MGVYIKGHTPELTSCQTTVPPEVSLLEIPAANRARYRRGEHSVNRARWAYSLTKSAVAAAAAYKSG